MASAAIPKSAPYLSSLVQIRPCSEPLRIHAVRRKEHPISRVAVVIPIGPGPLAYVQGRIENPKSAGIQDLFDHALRRPARRTELAVAAYQDRHA